MRRCAGATPERPRRATALTLRARDLRRPRWVSALCAAGADSATCDLFPRRTAALPNDPARTHGERPLTQGARWPGKLILKGILWDDVRLAPRPA